jgi:hypothetical protein
MKAKYRYNKISSMRSFEASPAKWFMAGKVKMSRKEVEKCSYAALKETMKRGELYAMQRVK